MKRRKRMKMSQVKMKRGTPPLSTIPRLSRDEPPPKKNLETYARTAAVDPAAAVPRTSAGKS